MLRSQACTTTPCLFSGRDLAQGLMHIRLTHVPNEFHFQSLISFLFLFSTANKARMTFSITQEGFPDYLYQDFQEKLPLILPKGKQSIFLGKM